jgi:hypothetical protein
MTTSPHRPRSSHQAGATGQTLPTYPAYSDVRFAMPCHSRARVLLKSWGSNLLRAWITHDQAELWQSVSYQIHLQDLQGKEPSVAFSLLYILYHTVSIPIDVIFRHINSVVSKKLLCLDQFPCSPEVPRTPTFKSQDLNDYKLMQMDVKLL